ncbi:symplekin domain-containing protein [Ordospora colligata]|uniref:Symplekin domain-containing protein n=1 Tax=Ordospora colligata OC4 TaxID=1354746 RepID=A0A0B2UER4_9MICR|nr:symplekin domain-containing protein [Ordospora colligata OC4]KHN69576.1 symplekin domain-containing protein [Ordospora colligata OC4]TBU15396.1 symplekin domain-containing protein [Ordospora colligata]TBU15496.1 symplekin domain-containing protein [Ordospora colligata]TBU18592.1 symplekin domain-containing protein [Ordospora colligata]
MDSIRRYLVEGWSEEGLTVLLFYMKSMDAVEMMYFLNMVTRMLDRNTAVVMLAYLSQAQAKGLKCPKYAQRALSYHIHVLSKKISKNVPEMLSQYVLGVKVISMNEGNVKGRIERNTKEFEPMDFLIDLVFETLVKASNAEIENSIQAHFNDEHNRVEINAVRESLEILCKIKEAEAVDASIARIVKMIGPEDSAEVVRFIGSNERYAHTFFLYAYLMNAEAYESMAEIILESVEYFRPEIVGGLVSIDLERVIRKVNDGSVKILDDIIRNRQVCVEKIAELASRGLVNIGRESVISVFKNNYGVLEKYAAQFELNVNEMIEISKANDAALGPTFIMIETAEEMNIFVDLLKDKGDAVVIDAIEGVSDEAKKEQFINTIIKKRMMKSQLRAYLVRSYLDDSRFVYRLLPYLEKADVYRHISNYVVDEESLNVFLKVIECSELLIFAHKISDVKKASRILDLCFRSPKFVESDFLFTLKTLENEPSPLVIQTLIQALTMHPGLKNFVISFLSRLCRRDIWKNEELVAEIMKCLKMLDTVCVDIIMCMNEEAMYKVLSRSNKLKTYCTDYLAMQRTGKSSRHMQQYSMLKAALKRASDK